MSGIRVFPLARRQAARYKAAMDSMPVSADAQDAVSVAAPPPPSDPEEITRQFPWTAGLNPAQMDAVVTTEGPVLMLAGAGTGKTKALTTRIAHLLLTRKTHPQGLLAVTFTNKAAREMQERVQGIIDHPTEGWWLGTFHSIAARLLRYHAELVGRQSNFTILDDDDQVRLLKQLIRAADIDDKRWKPRDLQNRISRWKDRGLMPSMVSPAEGQDFADGRGVELYHAYQDRLSTLNAVDFGDIILLNIELFRNNPDILKRYQQRFKYILVDEYQDTNVAQYLWLRLLAQGHKNICCVGDDDQSIYAWRGAEVGNILRFETDFPDAKVIRLEQNYRSTPEILNAASGLIAHNRDRLGKTLWTSDEAGERPVVTSYWDGEEEARGIAEEIEQLQRKGTNLSDIAILVRASHLMREFEERFTTVGIGYRVVGGPRFYERQEVRDALAFLRLIQTPTDDLALERIINVPKRGIGNTTVQKLYAAARDEGQSLYHAAHALAVTDDLGAAARRNITAFLTDLDRWRGLAASTPHPELTEIILDESGYTAMWQADKSPDSAGRLENLKELIVAMAEFENLTGFLEHVGLVLETFNDKSVDLVTLMTLHSAKGLEFNTVFLPGWEEGLFPSQRSMDQSGLKGLEEERRLAYVGVTRARQTLRISHAGSRRIHGQYATSLASRFIGELPEDSVEHVGGERAYSTGYKGGYGGGYGGSGYGSGVGYRQGSSSYGDGDDEMYAKLKSPGWQRAKKAFTSGRVIQGSRVPQEGEFASAKTFAIDERVFHQKFGYGTVKHSEGGKLTIEFDQAGEKKVMSSFVMRASEAG